MSRRPKLQLVEAAPAILGTHTLEIRDGVLLTGSDQHWLPGQPPSTATRAFVRLARLLSAQGDLRALILNGDLFDFPKVSRHPRLGWEPQPTVAAEIGEVRERMAEIADAAGPGIPLVVSLGNHDARLDNFLSQNAAAMEGVSGFALRDHIDPRWIMAWQVEINGPGPEGVLIRHRFKGGVSAGRGNVLAAGRSVVSGHTHQLNVTRVSNSLGHFWGVDLGTMAPSPPAPSPVTRSRRRRPG
jgi:3',5'-cyclic AMP phosphodiesterase CpdA